MQARRLVGAVEVDQHLVLGTHLRAGGVEVDHILVVAVHEIDLEALDAHAGIVDEDILHVAVDGPVAGPEDEADVLFLGVGAELIEVDLGNDLHQVGLLVDRPALVQDDILDAVCRREIDVILVGGVIDAGLEVHAVEVPVIPPVPGDLAGLHPAPVALRRSRGELVHHVAASEFLVFARDLDDTPREGTAGLAVLRDEVLAGADDALEHVVAALLDLLGHAGVEALEGGGGIQVADVETREVEEVGLGDAHRIAVWRLDDQRQEGRAGLVPVIELEAGIIVLEGALDLLFDRPVGRAAVRDDRVPVAGEGEFGLLGLDVDPLLAAGDETVGHALVVSPEDQVEGLVAERELIVAVAHGGLLIHGRVEGLIHALAIGLEELGLAAVDGAVGEGHRDGRRGKHLDAVRRDGILEGIEGDDDAAVGGLERLRRTLGPGREGSDRAAAEQNREEKGSFHHYAIFEIIIPVRISCCATGRRPGAGSYC